MRLLWKVRVLWPVLAWREDRKARKTLAAWFDHIDKCGGC